jgi:hypothetical protein
MENGWCKRSGGRIVSGGGGARGRPLRSPGADIQRYAAGQGEWRRSLAGGQRGRDDHRGQLRRPADLPELRRW